MSQIIKKLKNLHNDDGGQAIVFIALTLLLMVVFVMLIINTGVSVTGKVQMMNAADATVLSGATWMARGLNTVSVYNKTMAYILATIIVTESLSETHQLASFVLYGMFWTAKVLEKTILAPLGFALEAVVQVNYAVIFGGYRMETGQFNTILREPSIDGLYEIILVPIREPLWQLMKVISDANDGLASIIPFIAQIEAIHMGIKNGATVSFISPVIPDDKSDGNCDKDRLCLPVEQSDQFRDICAPTMWGKHKEKLPMKGDSYKEDEMDWIYHFPENSNSSPPIALDHPQEKSKPPYADWGSVDYIRQFSPHELIPIMGDIPPFVNAINRQVINRLAGSICDGDELPELKMKIKMNVHPSLCYKIKKGLVDDPFGSSVSWKHNYSYYKWRLTQDKYLGFNSNKYIDEYYDSSAPYNLCKVGGTTEGGYPISYSPDQVCIDGADAGELPFPETEVIIPANRVARTVITETSVSESDLSGFAPSHGDEPDANVPEDPENANLNTESFGECERLKDPYNMIHYDKDDMLSQKQGIKSKNPSGSFTGYFFGREENDTSWKSQLIMPSNAKKPFHSKRRKSNSNKCYDFAYDAERSVNDTRECCEWEEIVEKKVLVKDPDTGEWTETIQEVPVTHKESSQPALYFMEMWVLDSCFVEGEVPQQALTDFNQLLMDNINQITSDAIGDIISDLEGDWGPDPWGTTNRMDDLTLDQSSIKNVNAKYASDAQNIRIQQLDWDNDPDWKKQSKYFGIAYQTPKSARFKLQDNSSFESMSLGIFGYCSAEMYLPDHVPENLFSQEWRVRLLPVKTSIEEGMGTPDLDQSMGDLSGGLSGYDILGVLPDAGDLVPSNHPAMGITDEVAKWLIHH